jgi:DNA-directed RNA polymerase subunit RPC12/RpoP
MKIPVTCATCGKRYEVDGAYAGKRGKCATCGARMTIPSEDHAASSPPSEPEAYQLDLAHDSEQPNSFTPAQGSEGLGEPPPRRRMKKKNTGRSDARRGNSASSHSALSGRVTLIGLTCVAVVLVILAIFVPSTRMNVGRGIALTGLILFVYGYASGCYIAFTEDGLYGWLYLIFPPYAAYYFLSRWDEMSSRLVMIVIGLTLLVGGGRLLEFEHPVDAADNEAVAAPR